ncbi:TKL protein kinase [Saprolegnia diclina VS20]|uniref:TKL protein kinase n=1 Tax=Saprolegnia diclina (strain VS20) TaxID=1156394 RepID=T0R6W4_SAPDV|nr:TKL protein kinase [Saprolegnia diclina VS20]EQC25237.1 TKL protein kinase [Saprolegnia diclina VS20]|eukprot:XP_008621321.1 TKL protein kinase [Saprolegnia diclina VS20]
MGAEQSSFKDLPAAKPAPEPMPILNPDQVLIAQLKHELEQIKAKYEEETLAHASEVKDLTLQHELELELYAAQIAEARRLGGVAAADSDATVQRFAEERATHLMQQRLNSITEVDDLKFEHITGPLGFEKRDFPFAELKPGRIHDGTLVLRIQLVDGFKGNKDVLERFKKTLAIMQALNGGDGTLLRLIGACNINSDDPIAYVEYVTGMPLSEYLMNKQNATWAEKLWIASQVAKAIVHIHNLAVMHRDVSWSRVFVDATGNVKVFAGLKMRQVQAYESYLTAGITEARWGAPETLAKTEDSDDSGATTYTDKIDIFGLGLILISLVTRDLPFTHVMRTTGRADSPIDDNLVAARLKDPVEAIKMLAEPFDVDYACPSEEYKTLALACIRYDPERRPTAPEVVRRLETIRQAYSGGTIQTPDHAKVDLTIELLKMSGVQSPSAFGSPFDVWCEIKIDDEKHDAIVLPSITGNVTHVFRQFETLKDIEPLAHTVEFTLKTKHLLRTKTIGKISILLMNLLTLGGKELTLTARRMRKVHIFKDGDIVGSLEIAVTFGERLRGYLELFEQQTTVFLRNTDEDESLAVDLRKKRDLAVKVLLSGAP